MQGVNDRLKISCGNASESWTLTFISNWWQTFPSFTRINFCLIRANIGEVGFWTSLNLDILELDQDSRPWRVDQFDVGIAQGNPPPRWHVLFKGPRIYHWPLIGSPKHDFPKSVNPRNDTRILSQAFVVCCRSAWRQWCTILYTRSTIMPSFIYSHSTSLSLEWRIWSRWGIFISIEIMENHLDFQKVCVTKYCWCCRIPVPLGIYICIHIHIHTEKAVNNEIAVNWHWISAINSGIWYWQIRLCCSISTP